MEHFKVEGYSDFPRNFLTKTDNNRAFLNGTNLSLLTWLFVSFSVNSRNKLNFMISHIHGLLCCIWTNIFKCSNDFVKTDEVKKELTISRVFCASPLVKLRYDHIKVDMWNVQFFQYIAVYNSISSVAALGIHKV
jgi:hypothetical protein